MCLQYHKPCNLLQWSEYTNGARAAVVKMIDTYFNRRITKADMPYIKAELAYITESKDNLWRWLTGDGNFRYRNHVKDKRGNVVSCEAYLEQ